MGFMYLDYIPLYFEYMYGLHTALIICIYILIIYHDYIYMSI